MYQRRFRDLFYDGRREAVRNTASFKLYIKKNKLRYVVRVLYIKHTVHNVQNAVKVKERSVARGRGRAVWSTIKTWSEKCIEEDRVQSISVNRKGDVRSL